MAAFLTQKASNTAVIASVTATFTNPPQAGNLLVAVVTANVGVGSISITGFSTGTSIAVGVAGGLVIFYKVSAGNETSITASATLATLLDLHIFEYDGIDNASPLDKTSTTADSGSGVTSRASGTTATLTQANELAIAAVAMAGNNGGGASWTNSFVAEITTTDLITADIIVNATTALSTTGSWTTSQRAAGAIVTFLGETGDSYGVKIPLKPQVPVINWNNPITKGLLFDAPLFERGGTIITDKIARLTGTLTNGPTWASDLSGIGVKFASASSHYINFTKNTGLLQNYFSLEVLFKPTALPSVAAMIFYNGDDTGGAGLGVGNSSDSVPGSSLLLLFGGAAFWIPSATLSNNTIYHVVLSVNNTILKFFINDVEYDVTSNTDGGISTAGRLTIGCELNGSGNFSRGFDGTIFYCRAWKRPLNYQEAKQLYSNPWQIYTQPSFYQFLNNFTIPPGFISKIPQSVSQPLNFDSAISV